MIAAIVILLIIAVVLDDRAYRFFYGVGYRVGLFVAERLPERVVVFFARRHLRHHH